MKTTGVIVARFQTPWLHGGHKYLLESIQEKHNKVVVILGVSPVKGSARNPFDFYTREKLLKQYSAELFVLPLRDEASDAHWSRQLDQLLESVFPRESFILYGSRDCFIPYYSGHLPVEALPESGDHSATAIRDANADKVLASEDFRLGINYAYHNTYAKVYPTVDIALCKTEESRPGITRVLLGRKPGSEQWRFPGGFTDPTDGDYESAARRELKEECGEMETGPMQYLGSARIDDWRYRSEEDKIITLFFKTDYLSGEAISGDDLETLGWFTLEELRAMTQSGALAAEHLVLVDLLLKNTNS